MELQKPVKDMKKVKDYYDENQLRMFRFSCFNNASAIKGVMLNLSASNIEIAMECFDLAEQLYEEGVKRNYLKLRGIEVNANTG